MDKYDKGVLLGRGTFASVFKAIEKEVKLPASMVVVLGSIQSR